MKVHELITKLESLDPDLEVVSRIDRYATVSKVWDACGAIYNESVGVADHLFEDDAVPNAVLLLNEKY